MILQKLRTQKGFSLLELLLVVAVGAILILAGLAIYRNISQNAEVNESLRLLNVLKQETQRIFQGENTYTGLDNTVLTSTQSVPAQYTTGPGVIRTPFNTDVVVVVNGTNADEFDITFEEVPDEICAKLGVEYSTDDSDFVNLAIGVTDIEDPNVATVVAECSDGVDITWTFD